MQSGTLWLLSVIAAAIETPLTSTVVDLLPDSSETKHVAGFKDRAKAVRKNLKHIAQDLRAKPLLFYQQHIWQFFQVKIFQL